MSATAWDAGIYYVPNNIVQYLGLTYICSLANHNTVPVSNPTYWNVSTNLTGTILPWVAPQWDGGLYYVPTQIVAYLNQYYISTVKTFPPNHNIIPTSDVTYWTAVPAGGGGGSSGVTQLVAGTNISLSPAGGTGIVTVNSTASSGVSSVSGGTAISVSPTTGAVVVNNTGVTAIAVSSGITTTGATGSITLSNSGVLSVAGSGAGISANTVGGNVTIQNTGVTKFTVTGGTGLSISGPTGFVNLSLTPQFVSLATTNLNMAGYSIINVATIYGGTVGSLTIGLQYFTTINFGTNLQLNSGNDISLLAYSGVIDQESAIMTNIATTSYTLTSPLMTFTRTGGGGLTLSANVDLNCRAGSFLTLGNSGAGSYYQIQSAGSQTLTTPSTESITLTTGNVTINGNTTINGYLNMTTYPIYMNSATIYNAYELYNNNNDLHLTGITKNILLQTVTAGNNIQLSSETIYNTTSANYYLTATGSAELSASYFNFFSDCYFNSHNLYNVNRIESSANPLILQANYDMNQLCFGNLYIHTDAGHYIGLYQGSSYIQIDPSDNINLVAPTVNVVGNLSFSSAGTIDLTQGTVENPTQVYNNYGGIIVGGADGYIKSFQNGSGSAYFKISAVEDVTIATPGYMNINALTLGKFITMKADTIFIQTTIAGGHDININSGRDAFLTGLRDITLFTPTAGAYITLNAPGASSGISLSATNQITLASTYLNHTGTNITFTESTSVLVTAPLISFDVLTGYVVLKANTNEGHFSVGTNTLYSTDNQPLYQQTGTPTQPILFTVAQQDAIYTDAAGNGSITISMPYNMGNGNFYQVVVTEKSTGIVTAPTVWSQYSVNSSQFTVFVSSPTRPFNNILFSWLAIGPFS
jgi:hypothetical protein